MAARRINHLRMAALLVVLPVIAAAAPAPPCEGPPVPAFPEPGARPGAGLWSGDELRASGWQPAACLQWRGETKLAAAVAGRFRSTADVFERFGAVSNWTTIKYWSISRKIWRPLMTTAQVIDSSGRRIGDLSPAALGPGEERLVLQQDDNTGETKYRVRVLVRDAQHLVVATENVTPIRASVVTLFEPGALQTVTFVTRDGPDAWRTYQIARVGGDASSLALKQPGSLLNRLEAMRRYMAGEPTDQTPPLAAQ